jgi:hypothetical protein
MLITANELVENYKDVPLNGTKPASAGFFVRIAFENIIQGIWNSSFDSCSIPGRNTIYIDEKILTKVFQKLIIFNENSEELYWSVLYSFSLRSKSGINRDITQSKMNVSEFISEKKEKYSYKDRNKINTVDNYGLKHSNNYVNSTSYGKLPRPKTGSRESDY